MPNRIKSPDDGFAYIESFLNVERGLYQPRLFRLERMEALLKRFGNPHLSYKTIHVAGSKGKGSTAAYIASILDEAGYKTGLYTSPHVVNYRERITLAGKDPGDELYLSCMNSIKDNIAHLEDEGIPEEEYPTTFELLTLLGFLLFREAGCSWGVIETGLGGRLDATNVVSSEASVITPIELEHTEYLGTTLGAIAGEKAGIIKPARPVLSAPQHPEAEKVLRRKAEEMGSPITFLYEEAETIQSNPSSGGTEITVKWKSGSSIFFTIPMIGRIQGENAVLASIAASRCITFPEEVFKRAAEKTRLFGRGELLSADAPVLLDGAHTVSSIKRVLDSFKTICPSGSILVFGAVEGKNIQGMAEVLAPEFDAVYITTPGTFKRSSPRQTKEIFAQLNPRTFLEIDPPKAAAAALRTGKPVLVTGSFYLVSEIRKEMIKVFNS